MTIQTLENRYSSTRYK